MGHQEEGHNGHHHSSDDSSDDDGHSLKNYAKKRGSPDKESHGESSSSSSSSKSTSHHHHNHQHHGGDDGARALGEEEEVVSPVRDGAEDNDSEGSLEETVVPVTNEEEPASNRTEETDHRPITAEEEVQDEGGLFDSALLEREEGMREGSDDDESEVSDAPVYDKFLVETSLKEDPKVEANDSRRSVGFDEACLEKQESGNKYNVVLSETVEGIHDAEKCDVPESAEEIVVSGSVNEIAEPEMSGEPGVVAEPEEENSFAEVIEENSVSSISEERDSSDAVVVKGEGEGHADLTSSEISAPEETLNGAVISEFEGNGNVHEKTVVIWIHNDDESVKDVIKESNSGKSAISEKQAASLEDLAGGEQMEISATVVLEGDGEGHAEESAPEETEGEPVEIEANGIALEGDMESHGPNDHKPEESDELESKSRHDDRLEGGDGGSKEPQTVLSHRDLSVELSSPLEHQKRFMRQFMTPSPPKRENSVYKIVMALEGLQVGEKCIHGEIDHGICHQRYGDRRMSSSPSFSARGYRETSTSPKDEDESATPSFVLGKGENAEVRVSDGEKTEVDSDWSFVHYDSQSGVTTQQTSTIKTETYTDTVVFRRDDGFLPRTPGRSPLSGSQSMRAVFNQVDASGPTTPRLKIVHKFPAEKTDNHESHDGASTSTLESLTVEGESEVERILRLQETHDLVCPVCSSCITKRVILRKRKRTTVVSNSENWVPEVPDEEEESIQDQAHDNVSDGNTIVEQYEDYGCLGCFTFLFRREKSLQRTQVVDVSITAEEAASVSVESTPLTTDQSAGSLPVPQLVVSPPALTDEDYDNRCLPIFFTWRRKTTNPIDAEIVTPLLSNGENKSLSEESPAEVLQTQSRDVPSEDLSSETQGPAASEIQPPRGSEIQPPPAPEIQLPPAPEIQPTPASEIQPTPASEIQPPPASEIQPPPATEIRPPPASEILELPVAPGAVEGVQLPVVVVESREDRLCFPFLWRRTSKTKQAQSELLQPLLKEEDKSMHFRYDDGKQQTKDFSLIEDDVWMRQEVLLGVPVSVPPQETLASVPGSSPTPDSSETAAESDTSLKAIRVTEAERKVDCLCFPSWSSSETASEETESSRITDSLQVAPAASGSEASETISPSKALKETVSSVTSGTEGAAIVLNSPSLKGAVLPVAPSTEDREAQRASLNCIDILIPSYPWGPRGTGSRKELLGIAEEHPGTTTPTQFEFSAVGQVVNTGVVILSEQDVSEGFTKLGSLAKKPREEVFGSVEEPESESEKPRGVIGIAKRPKEESRNKNLQIKQTHNGFPAEDMDEEEVPRLVRKPPTSRHLMSSAVKPLPAEEGPQVVELVETDDSSLPEVLEKNFCFSPDSTRTPDLPDSVRTPDLPDSVRTPDLPDSVRTPDLPDSVRTPDLPDSVRTPDLPESVRTPDIPDSVRTPDLPDSVRTPDLSGVLPVDEEELREKGSWSCCLPSYTQLAYQPIEDRLPGEQAAPAVSGGLLGASDPHVSDESESIFHEEIKRETTIDARITTETTTTKSHTDATKGETIDAIRIDTSVNYVSALVQHDKGDMEGTLHLNDHPTFSLHPADKLPAAHVLEQPMTQPPLGPTDSTGYAALARFLEDEEENGDKDAAVNEWLADSSRQGVTWKQAEPLKPVAEVEQGNGEEVPILSNSSEEAVDEEIRPSVTVPPVSSDLHVEEEDRSCCLPNSKWRWGTPKLSSEAAHLQEPLLGKHTAHVTLEQIHEVKHTTTGPRAEYLRDEEECNCFPWSGRYNRDVAEVDTTVTVTVDDTVIEVEGADAASTLEAATAAAEDAGMMHGQLPHEPEYLKSIVYGGLDVSLTSLGVVASAAGGDAKTRNVLALGLANLIFGFIAFYYKIQDLHKESPARFQQSVGPRFWMNGLLAMISFLFFGALPVLTFGFSFQELNDHDYKMAATVLASTIAIVFLGCGKVAAKMTELSYRRTLTTLITTGIVAAVAGFYTGEYISKVLEKYGILDE